MQFTFRKQVSENSRQGTFAICNQRLKSPVRNHFGTANFIPNEMTGNFCTVCHLSFENQLSRPVLAVFNICWKDQGTKHYTRHNFLKKKNTPKNKNKKKKKRASSSSRLTTILFLTSLWCSRPQFPGSPLRKPGTVATKHNDKEEPFAFFRRYLPTKARILPKK